MRFIDLTGQKFDRLTVICRASNNRHGCTMWLCKCDCGIEKIILGNSLRNGRTKSCGCLWKKRNLLSTCKTYRTWQHMHERCTNPNHPSFKEYKRKKIKICYRWSKNNPKGFENFYKDVGEPPSKYHSIDRINNNRGYYINNWRWATPKEQANNRKNNIITPRNKDTQYLYKLVKENKIDRKKLYTVICKYDWLVTEILQTQEIK
jgi:hypothetical protein